MSRFVLTALAVFLTLSSANGESLATSNYIELPLGAIKADGWLQMQLERQRDGLTGHLDEIYPEVVGMRNAWLGGDGDAWERGPYWIDGLLPLAYILNDRMLKDKALMWVEAILGSQKEDGYFGPDTDRSDEPGLQRGKSHDWWPRIVALKIVKQYYMATADQRAIHFLDKYFRYQLSHLPEHPLDHWSIFGAQRGGDNLDIVYWFYNITGEDYLLELGDLIHAQSTPWTQYFLDGNILFCPNELHCVNLAQGFKEPVIYYQRNKDTKQLEAVRNAEDVIRRTIGFPTGLWAGDELINFGDPTRGSELCTAVEMMFSLEEILKVTGDTHWADYLERVAFNALPAQITDDFSARQYYQQLNQIECSRASQRNFSSPHRDTDQIFGVLNGYPCCTCNMHQGWPKFTQNLWYATTDGGLAALVYAPSSVKAKVADGVDVLIKEETLYPFDGKIKLSVDFPDRKVRSASFPLRFRVPSWCSEAVVSVNGTAVNCLSRAGETITISRKWGKGDIVTLEFPMEISCSRWYDSSAVIERGPLVYALKMNETWTKKEFEEPLRILYGDWYYEVKSDSKWNYCLYRKDISQENINSRLVVTENQTDAATWPWDSKNAPISIKVPAKELYGWQPFRGSAGPIPYYANNKTETGPETWIELIPYGCTTLRITEFPVRK